MTKQPKTTRTWDQYVKEADHEPFILTVGDDEIVIKTPTGEQVMEGQRLATTGGTLEDQLKVICGSDVAEQILPLAKAAPAGAINQLVLDIMEHFDISVGEGPSPT